MSKQYIRPCPVKLIGRDLRILDLGNLTPADVFYGRGEKILGWRETIKLNTLAMRRKMHYDNRSDLNLMG